MGRQEILDAFFQADERAGEALFCRNADQVAKAIADLKATHLKAEPYLPAVNNELYETDIEELSDYLTDLEMERWSAEADPLLQSFCDDFYCIVNDDYGRGETPDIIKARCINIWRTYFSKDTSGYKIPINAKQYMKDWFEDDYLSCMDTAEALEKYLQNI